MSNNCVFSACPNPQATVIHTRVLWNDGIRSSTTCDDSPALTKFLDVPGIQKVFIDRYEITIEKGEAFSWDEIKPRVMEIVESQTKLVKSMEK